MSCWLLCQISTIICASGLEMRSSYPQMHHVKTQQKDTRSHVATLWANAELEAGEPAFRSPSEVEQESGQAFAWTLNYMYTSTTSNTLYVYHHYIDQSSFVHRPRPQTTLD